MTDFEVLVLIFLGVWFVLGFAWMVLRKEDE